MITWCRAGCSWEKFEGNCLVRLTDAASLVGGCWLRLVRSEATDRSLVDVSTAALLSAAASSSALAFKLTAPHSADWVPGWLAAESPPTRSCLIKEWSPAGLHLTPGLRLETLLHFSAAKSHLTLNSGSSYFEGNMPLLILPGWTFRWINMNFVIEVLCFIEIYLEDSAALLHPKLHFPNFKIYNKVSSGSSKKLETFGKNVLNFSNQYNVTHELDTLVM